MAKSVLDIVIKLSKEGGADQETVKGLYQVKRSILDAAAVAGTLVAAGYTIKKVLDETVGSLVAYADEVRRVQNATGANAEDASKLIQILDDQKISYDQLEKAIQKSGKAYDFSINGIANMSDSYLQLESSQKRAEFMQERFGKQWISFVPIMQQGKQAILDAASAVDKNLVLTQKAVDAAREYEIGMDNLNDSVMGLKVSLGQELIPITNQVIDGFNVWIRAIEIAKEKNDGGLVSQKEWNAALEQAVQETAASKSALMQHADAVAQDTEDEKANAAALKEVSAAHQSMLGLIGNIASENKSFADKQAEVTAKMQENRAEAEKLYPWQKTQLDELNQKYADMSATYDANAAAHNAAMGKIQFDLFVTKLSVDGVTDAEFLMEQQAGLMFGVFDQNSINTATNMNAVADAVNNGTLKVKDMDAALKMMEKGYSIEVVLNTIAKMAGSTWSNSETRVTTGNNKRAGGGPVVANKAYIVGEQGPELFMPSNNGMIIPNGGQSQPVTTWAGNGGGGNVYVNLTIASPLTIMDQQNVNTVLLPFILNGVREAKARGSI